MNGDVDTGASLGFDAGTAEAMAAVAEALANQGNSGDGVDPGSGGGGVDPGGGGSTGEGGFSGAPGGDNTGGLLSSEDILKRGRELALQGVPLQISNLFEALAQLRARAAGSTAEILPSIIGQLSQMRAQYSGASQAIARRLGFAGGGQTEREQGKALAGATRQYGGLITGQQQTSFAALIKQLSELQPSLSAAARPPSTSTSASESTQEGQPMNFGQWGQAIAAAVSTARQLQQFYASQSPPTGVQPHPELPAASEATLFGAGGM